MEGKDFIAMVLIAFLSLWGTLYLETDLKDYFVPELFVILLLIIVAVGIFYGIAAGKDWAWPSLALFFLIAAANCVLIYIAAGNTTPFTVTACINLVGFVVAVSRSVSHGFAKIEELPALPPLPPAPEQDEQEEGDLMNSLETYEVEPDIFQYEEDKPEEEVIAPKERAAAPAGKKKKRKPKQRKRKKR